MRESQFIVINALFYSLGYKCIYIFGYNLKDNDSFDSNDAHVWSLVRKKGK